MPQRDRTSLLVLLNEQLAFLKSSAGAYDRGLEAEAKRLAVAIRVLVHDTGQSHSLLTQLGIKERLRWKNTALEINEGNLAPTNGLAIAQVTAGGASPARVRYVPALEMFSQQRSSPPTLFDAWWNEDVTKDGRGNRFSRRDFVLTVANKEGGAHVDPSLNEAYRHIVEENSLGMTVFEGPPSSADRLLSGRAAEGNAALASVRQVAFEVITTIEHQAPFLLFSLGVPERPASKLTPESPCPCRSGRAAKDCHLSDGARALDLGNMLLERSPLDAAWAYSFAAQEGQPNGAFNLGLALHAAADFEGAEAAFDTGMQAGHGGAASNLGVLRAERGDESGAMAAWEEAYRLGDENGGLNLAKSSEKAGDEQRAEIILRKLFETGSAVAGLRVSRILRMRGDLVEAREIYIQLEAGGDDTAAFNLARLDFDTGQPQAARQRLSRLSRSEVSDVASNAKSLLEQIDAHDPG